MHLADRRAGQAPPRHVLAPLLIALVATAAPCAPDPALRALQHQVLERAVPALEAMAVAAQPPELASDVRMQLLMPLALVAPERAEALAAELPPDGAPRARALALAGSLARDPASARALLAAAPEEGRRESIALAAQYLASESPEGIALLAGAVPSAEEESLVRIVAAQRLASRDPSAALALCDEIESQEAREGALLRIAETGALDPEADWARLLASIRGRVARSALLASRAERLRATDPAASSKRLDEATAEWSRARPDSPAEQFSLRVLSRAVVSLAPDRAGEVAAGYGARLRLGWGQELEGLALLGPGAPEAVAAEVTAWLAAPPQRLGEGLDWIRKLIAGIGVGVGVPSCAEIARTATGDERGAVLHYAVLAGPERGADFAAAEGWLDHPWVLAQPALELARRDLPLALLVLGRLPQGGNGEATYFTCEAIQRAADGDPDAAMDALATLAKERGSLDGLPVAGAINAAAERRLARGGGMVPGAGMDLPVDLSALPMGDGTRAAVLAALSVAMAERYPDQARAAMLEALRLAGTGAGAGGALPPLLRFLGPVDPEAAWQAVDSLPKEGPPEGGPSPRLPALLELASGLSEALGWSERQLDW